MFYGPFFAWWFLLQLLGLVGLPLTFRLLGNLPDRGYAFARPVGLLLTGYLLWLGGSLGFWRNSTGATLIAMTVVLGIGLWLYSGRPDKRVSIWSWLRTHTRYWLAVELLFAVALFLWTVYKAYNPNLETAGGEKWMEIAFLNATLRSDGFPPQDPWLSGFGISYYYFGYVLMALVTRLSGLPPTVAYNLFIPALLALTLTGAFSLVYNMVLNHAAKARTEVQAIGFGTLGALFVGIVGNLEGLLEVLHSRGLLPPGFWRWLDIIDINQPPTPSGWVPTRFIWWWRASRVVHDCSFQGLLTGDCNPPNNWEVIDEFPFFSFLLGDVHPHVLALPFVLLALALALNLLLSRRTLSPASYSLPHISNLKSALSDLVAATFGGWTQFFVFALCLGALGFLNTWDFPIYLFLVSLVFALQRKLVGAPWWWAETLAVGLGLALVGGVLHLPFYLGLQSQAGGILPNLFNPTKLQQFLVFFGLFLFVIVSYLALLSRDAMPSGWWRRLPSTLTLTVLAPVLAMFLLAAALAVSPSSRSWVEELLRSPELRAVLGQPSLGRLSTMALRIRLSNPWTFLVLGGLLGWVLVLIQEELRRKDRQGTGVAGDREGELEQPSFPQAQLIALTSSDWFALVLIGVGLLLLLAVEFVYLRDLFGHRMNTVFKFYFQGWVLLALSAAYGVSYVSSRIRGVSGLAWRLALTLLVLGGLVYPALAIPNKTGNFSAEPTLDGQAWLEAAHPDDYAAIRWLQANASNGAVILEAPGESYRYTGRVSALTGLPTLLGWDFHEYQWRGTYDEPARRKPEIDILYNTLDLTQTLTLLDKYDISYAYVGPIERERYNPTGLAKFERLMDVVYQQGAVTIYQRRRSDSPP